MNILSIFLSVFAVGLLAACAKVENQGIQDNLIVGTWSGTTEIKRITTNEIPTKNDTIRYEQNTYLLCLQSGNDMWIYQKGQADTARGTYKISGTQLFRRYAQGGLEYKDTLNFEVSKINLKIYKVIEIRNGTDKIRTDYEFKLTRN